LDKLRENGAGDPATNEPFGTTVQNLKSAIAGETHEYTDMFVLYRLSSFPLFSRHYLMSQNRYPGFARSAREEGFDEIAEWFDVRN
jgi:rubrerythrin